MGNNVILVVGATGDVGQGIVEAALDAGYKVVAAGRNKQNLDRIASRFNTDSLGRAVGSVSSEEEAQQLWHQAMEIFGVIDHVIISVNAANRMMPLADWQSSELIDMFAGNVVVHLVAVKVFQPLLPDHGVFLGIGGGTADFIFPKLAPVSMGQAALRMMYKGFAKECKTGAAIRELMIISMVAGESNQAQAQPEWLTAIEVGKHVCAILDTPEQFSQPILRLVSRDQVGQPEA